MQLSGMPHEIKIYIKPPAKSNIFSKTNIDKNGLYAIILAVNVD